MEALDPDTGRWLPAPGRMAAPRKYAAAAPLAGRLYVCGGLRSAERQRLASVEAYDPREGVFREVRGFRKQWWWRGLGLALQQQLMSVGACGRQ